ncbi:MAG TPA: hypothetical protein VIP77_04905 [Jiangellaceae bacterium]
MSSNEPVKVQLVVYAEGQIGLAVVDNPARAHEYARAVEGVVVELPALADYRAAKEPGRPASDETHVEAMRRLSEGDDL